MPPFIYFLLVMELFFVSYIDFKFGKIHNFWSILNIFSYILFLFIFSDFYLFNVKTFVFPLAFIFVGYILYLMNIMGAGDSKYLFSFFLLIPVENHERLFLCLAYTTVYVGVSLLLITIVNNLKNITVAIKSKDVGAIREIFGSKFSYAPVIFISWIWFGWINQFFIT